MKFLKYSSNSWAFRILLPFSKPFSSNFFACRTIWYLKNTWASSISKSFDDLIKPEYWRDYWSARDLFSSSEVLRGLLHSRQYRNLFVGLVEFTKYFHRASVRVSLGQSPFFNLSRLILAFKVVIKCFWKLWKFEDFLPALPLLSDSSILGRGK